MNEYIVALEVGGIMEQPHFTYVEHQTISANSAKEAERIYNKKTDATYFYGHVVGENGIIHTHDEVPKSNSFG